MIIKPAIIKYYKRITREIYLKKRKANVRTSATNLTLQKVEILLNCMGKNVRNSGYDLELIRRVKDKGTIPVIASSGAGNVEQFSEVWKLPATDKRQTTSAENLRMKEGI